MFCAFGYINFGEKNSWEKHSAGGSRYYDRYSNFLTCLYD